MADIFSSLLACGISTQNASQRDAEAQPCPKEFISERGQPLLGQPEGQQPGEDGRMDVRV